MVRRRARQVGVPLGRERRSYERRDNTNQRVRGLWLAYDRIDALVWHSLGFPHDEGPRLVVEGACQGHEVLLQVSAYAPDDEEPGMRFDTARIKS